RRFCVRFCVFRPVLVGHPVQASLARNPQRLCTPFARDVHALAAGGAIALGILSVVAPIFEAWPLSATRAERHAHNFSTSGLTGSSTASEKLSWSRRRCR